MSAIPTTPIADETPVARAWRTRESWLPKVVPLLALFLIVLAFSGASGFLSERNLETVLRELPVLMLVAVGATLPILLGSIDLSLGGIMVLAGGTAAVLVPEHGEKALLLAPLIGLTAGLLNGVIVAGARLPSFLVTLGTLYAFEGLGTIIMNGVPHPYLGEISREIGNGRLSILGLNLSYLFVIALTITALIVLFIARARHGRYIVAVGGGERVSRLAGINVRRVKILTFALAGLLAGLAAMFLTMRSSAATPTMGDPFLLTSIAAVVIGGTSLSGGIGGPQWTVLGALVIIVLDNGMTLSGIDPDYQTIIRGLVIIVASALTIRRLSDVVK